MYEVTKGLGRTHRLAKSLAVNIVGEIRVNHYLIIVINALIIVLFSYYYYF